MREFENTLINGIYKSQYVMSWTNAGGLLNRTMFINGVRVKSMDAFRDWLNSQALSERDVQDIINFAGNGKLELQESARRFLMGK